MTSFQEMTFSELLSDAEVFVDGDWVESKDQDPNGDVRLIQLADIGDGFYIDKSSRFLNSETAKRLKCTYLKEGDILVARMPDPLGRACIFPQSEMPCVTVVDVCIIRPNQNKVDNRWLMHTINSPVMRQRINEYVTGTTRQRISRGNFSKLKVSVPSLAEQRRIASILDKADELRQKRQQAIEKLDQLLQATFIDMFGDPVSNPKGFDLVNLESILAKKLISGAYFPKETYTDVGGTPMVHMGDVFYGVVKPNNLKQVKINNEEIEKYRVTNNDLLIARRSLTYEGAAKACRIECFDQHMIFESSLIRLSPNLLKILPEFLYHYLNNSDVRNNFIIPYITKSTISGINQANLNKVKVLLPPLAKQEKFIEICDKFKQLGKKLTDDLNKLDELFKSLQNQAFSGNL